MRLIALFLSLTLAVACAPVPAPTPIGPDGLPVPRVYRISPSDAGDIQFRMLDAVNTLRQASGAGPLQLNAQLNAAAATHSRDMANQNRPWHFGSDGSSPIDRVIRVGYVGRFYGEAISETYESELETLAAWMQEQSIRRVILEPKAQDLGFSWYQENGGKIWWTMILGGPGEAITPSAVPMAQGF